MLQSILFIVCAAIYSAKGLLLTIDQGTLNGTYLRARDGKLFNAFFGIPFAKPPTGSLRLKAPVTAEPWEGIFDATQTPVGCPEWDTRRNETKGDEDCLNLNVFTPLNAREGDNISVLFYIYGGQFKMRNTVDNGPQYLMTENLIVVMPNYRGGLLGFLSTGDTVIPGNFGLKDQLLALKWTRQNIRSFGGDPDQITLHGHSSGAMSVHLHTLSPASKGLFQRVIIQSGSAFGSLSYWGSDVSRAIAKEFAGKVGCPSVTCSEDMYQCFMNVPVDVFVSSGEQFYAWDIFPVAPIRPTIEDERAEDAFLVHIPELLPYHSPELPWLIGLTTGEAAGQVAKLLANGGKKVAKLDENYDTLLPVTLQYLWNTEEKYLNNVSRIIKSHYFGDKNIGPESPHEMVQMYTHGSFGIGVLDAIHSYPGPKHVYWYDYRANFTTQNDLGFYDGFLGVAHSDDHNLFLYIENSANQLKNQDILFSQELVRRFANFVQTSDPNSSNEINSNLMSHWEPVASERIEYLLLTINGSMETDLYKEVYPFWKSLPIGSKYGISKNGAHPYLLFQDRIS